MKNAGKACNNRLYRHIRTFEKIVKNYFVIYHKQKKLRDKSFITEPKCVKSFIKFIKMIKWDCPARGDRQGGGVLRR